MKRSPHGLHQRLEALDPLTPVRVRDFRRTASLWFEPVDISRSRLAYYLGHATRDMASLYQQTVPTKAELDEDVAKITAWLSEQLALLKAKAKRIWSPRAEALVAQLLDESAQKPK